ncbi:aminoacetone oxidase family FAD-binding enzyme [Sandarakinorhabdus cyanobacteriorum]|uniref:Aminoacetone oxidase family FAD-binding enzyme n=1 Tax=Sandarakinorhabdus cyanobacteriorum TaxID=1981098 RepID=A0A255YD85_9SPHN|nr:NAD(P)/FAD-dependent oxidoreductase [Sandarakinorhabdus cyanobacteriorum]OYQ27196.1 aminoacetone oxidase family FAD-binding enzyme [Sandarakinorhabdus cyanobacteriorum]
MHDAIILGAGGAGLFCAATAGQAGARVLVVDHNQEPGKKILISGGGRCNFTNVGAVPDRYLSENRHFARSALSRYTPADFVALVEKHRIAYHEKTLGQLFCDGSARQIVALLMDECAAGGVDFAFGASISDVTHADGLFSVSTSAGRFTAPNLVIATGGPAIPKLGATGFAYQLGKQFGCRIIPPRPALVPFTLPQGENLFRELAGVAAEVVAKAGKTAFREAALFTHKGLSGPAMLQVSSYWRHGEAIAVDFLPDAPADWLQAAKRQRPRAGLKSVLAAALPERLAEALSAQLALPGELGAQKDAALVTAMGRLKAWAFRPDGTEGFAKAEVTAGGIDTAALSSRTMMANQIGGLFAIGEAVDVTGWLGGYNFQWAWASAHAAGQAIAERVRG